MHLLFDGKLGAFDTLRFVEEKITAGLWSLDVKTGSMGWSQGLYRLLGLEPGSVEPSLNLFRSMMHPDDRLSRGDIDRVLKEGISFEREFRIVQRDGRIRWVANRGEPVLNKQGKAERAIGIISDVTNKQNAVRELHASEQRHRTLTKAASTILWTTSADRQVFDLPACQRSHAWHPRGGGPRRGGGCAGGDGHGADRGILAQDIGHHFGH